MSNGECSGRRNTHIPRLICSKHLDEYFGLKIFHMYIDIPLSIYYGPWTLSPSPGVYFRKNDVIFPLRSFYDKIFRPSQTSLPEEQRKYKINPRTNQFMRKAIKDGRLTQVERLIYEMIRNISAPSDNLNVNPTGVCENNPKPVAFMSSKMAVSNTFIQKHSMMNYINNLKYVDKDDSQMKEFPKDGADALSLAYRYLMSKCEFQSHVVKKEGEKAIELARLIPNAMFIKDVGLVATKYISDPEPIVINGEALGIPLPQDHSFYNENIIEVPKEVVNSRVGPNSGKTASQNSARKAFIDNNFTR